MITLRLLTSTLAIGMTLINLAPPAQARSLDQLPPRRRPTVFGFAKLARELPVGTTYDRTPDRHLTELLARGHGVVVGRIGSVSPVLGLPYALPIPDGEDPSSVTSAAVDLEVLVEHGSGSAARATSGESFTIRLDVYEGAADDALVTSALDDVMDAVPIGSRAMFVLQWRGEHVSVSPHGIIFEEAPTGIAGRYARGRAIAVNKALQRDLAESDVDGLADRASRHFEQ